MPFCNKCGNQHQDEAQFCPKCGNAITSNGGIPTQSEQVQPKTEPPVKAPDKPNKQSCPSCGLNLSENGTCSYCIEVRTRKIKFWMTVGMIAGIVGIFIFKMINFYSERNALRKAIEEDYTEQLDIVTNIVTKNAWITTLKKSPMEGCPEYTVDAVVNAVMVKPEWLYRDDINVHIKGSLSLPLNLKFNEPRPEKLGLLFSVNIDGKEFGLKAIYLNDEENHPDMPFTKRLIKKMCEITSESGAKKRGIK